MVKAFKMRLEYGMGPEYERRHAEIWPEVEQMIHEYGGSDCSVFLDERSGTLFGCMKIEDEEKWQKIREDVLCRKWLDHISSTIKVNRENYPEATPLRLVFHVD